MTPADIPNALISIIQHLGKSTAHYVKEPGRNFCRKRKLPFETMLAAILGMGAVLCQMNFWTILDARKMLHPPLRLFSKEPRFCQRHLRFYFNHLLK